MNRYNKLKQKTLSVFASASGEWLTPGEAAGKLNFVPPRAAWTYFKRLWKFGLLERCSWDAGSLRYRISEEGLARLRWLRLHRD